jgi:hypothetical protein
MSRTTTSPLQRNRKANNELLQKGLMLAFIGLAVLVGPHFMAPSNLRDVVASSAAVGWFAVVLGGAFVVRYAVRRSQGNVSKP